MGKRFARVSTLLALVVIVISVDPLHLFNHHVGDEDERLDIRLYPLDGAVGPESFAFDERERGPYTGVSDGRILQWLGQDKGWRQFALSAPYVKRERCGGPHHKSTEHICGRPLGLQFHRKSGYLYVADAYLGLLAVSSDGTHTRVVATSAGGVPFKFTNAVEIDQESGVVYFTDTSAQFSRRDFILALLSGDKSGRLMSYNLETKDLNILAEGISFANGVALSEDKSFLAIVETLNCRVLRYWLTTPKAGKIEVLADLPGFPDNIKRSPKGGFWVAMFTKRSKALKMLVPQPWLGKLLKKTTLDLEKMASLVLKWKATTLAMRVGEEGRVHETLEGKKWGMPYISEVLERNSSLWIGSVVMPHFGVINR